MQTGIVLTLDKTISTLHSQIFMKTPFNILLLAMVFGLVNNSQSETETVVDDFSSLKPGWVPQTKDWIVRDGTLQAVEDGSIVTMYYSVGLKDVPRREFAIAVRYTEDMLLNEFGGVDSCILILIGES